jgi:hypothetical protein
MLSAVQRVRRAERRSLSELVREALGLYCRVAMLPTYKPTGRELRAIEAGRAAFRRGDYITLDEYRNELEGRPDQARQKSARSARNQGQKPSR